MAMVFDMSKTSYKRLNRIKRNYELYLFILPTIIYIFIFNYLPMYGVIIAFKDFIPSKGIWGSQWVGFKHFTRFFESYYFWELIRNTIGLSVYRLIVSFSFPIVFALMLNQVQKFKYKKFVQTVTYAPHFISTVVLVGMINVFISPRGGLINIIINLLGGETILFAAEPKWFKTLYVFSGIWQELGWNSIIYLAALAGISPALYDAAQIDGANKIKRVWYIDIPGILPTIIVLLILSIGKIMNVGFQKAYLMQNPLNLESSEIISTFVYKVGLLDAQFSFSTAVNLFNTVINFILIISVNAIAKRVSEISLW